MVLQDGLKMYVKREECGLVDENLCVLCGMITPNSLLVLWDCSLVEEV